MTNIIILVLAGITLISIVFSMILFTKVLELNKELDNAKLDLNKTKEDAQELVEIEPGDNAIVPGYGLSTKGSDDEKSILNFELFDDVARKIITVPFVCASVDEEKRCSNDVYISLATGAAKSLILN
jgi:hypothetical protein